jgi:hypothetical protein
MYIATALIVAMMALVGLVTPSAEAASNIHCESTGGGRFVCDTSIVRPRYHWTVSGSAAITQNLGMSAVGTCTVGTKPTVIVTAYYPLSSTVSVTTPRPITVSTSFSCTGVAL